MLLNTLASFWLWSNFRCIPKSSCNHSLAWFVLKAAEFTPYLASYERAFSFQNFKNCHIWNHFAYCVIAKPDNFALIESIFWGLSILPTIIYIIPVSVPSALLDQIDFSDLWMAMGIGHHGINQIWGFSYFHTNNVTLI